MYFNYIKTIFIDIDINDFNIIKCNDIILRMMMDEYLNKHKLYEKINNMKIAKNINYIDKMILLNDINKLSQKLIYIESGIDILYYFFISFDIITKYQYYKQQYSGFFNTDKNISDNILKLINQYLHIAKQYINIIYSKKIKHINLLNESYIYSFNDCDRINTISREKYNKTKQFKKCIEEYLCNQYINNLDNKLMLILQLIKKKHIDIDTLTKKNLIKIIKELKLPLLDDINLIYLKLTGNKPNPISKELYDKLIIDYIDFDKQYVLYKSINNDIKNMNKEYILYILLQKHNYKCKYSDFNRLDISVEISNKYAIIKKNIFNKLGWL